MCRACGVVLESHILDEGPEWRYDTAKDRSRVGEPGAALGTFVEASHIPKRRRGMAFAQDPRQVSLEEGMRVVEHHVTCLRLSTTGVVCGRAKELFSDVNAVKPVRADTRRAMAAAALYFACKLENAGREVWVIATACDVPMRALNSAISECKEHLHEREYYPRLFDPLQAGTLIDVNIDRLGLEREERRKLWREAHQLDELCVRRVDCGRKPRTICSGILWLAVERTGVAVTKRQVSDSCRVCQQTLDKVVNQMRNLQHL